MHDSKTTSIEKHLPPTRSSWRASIDVCALLAFSPIVHLIVGCCASLLALSAHAQCEAHSSANRVALLELYTSEGCNSCPPAERWLSSLPSRGLTFDRLIPLAFHVDYWDQLGWPDTMAKAQFSERQRNHSRRSGNSVIYTPQFLLNGIDYRADNRIDQWITELDRAPAAAELFLRQRLSSTGLELEIDVRLSQKYADPVQTFVAVTEDGLESAIKAGENQGKLLHHDFVVRDLVPVIAKEGSGAVHWKSLLVLGTDWKRGDLSLVVFVQNQRSGEVLQAVKTPLCVSR